MGSEEVERTAPKTSEGRECQGSRVAVAMVLSIRGDWIDILPGSWEVCEWWEGEGRRAVGALEHLIIAEGVDDLRGREVTGRRGRHGLPGRAPA